jgi:hypothetical protein
LKRDLQVAVDTTKEGEKMTASWISAAAPKAVPKKEKPAEAPEK